MMDPLNYTPSIDTIYEDRTRLWFEPKNLKPEKRLGKRSGCVFVAGEENLTGLYVDSIKAINRSGSKEQ